MAAALTIFLARRLRPDADPTLLPVAYLLAGWGILAIWRVSPVFGWRQAIWLCAASAALLLVLRSPGDLLWLRKYRYVWLAFGLATILLTLFLGTNPSGGEPKLWLGCCGVYFQPSEPLRLLLVAFLASFLGERVRGSWNARQPPLAPTLAPLLAVWGVSALLLLVQRDLGTGSLFLVLLAVLLYLASGRWSVLAAAFGLTAMAGVLGYASLSLVRLRVTTWLNPWADTSGAAYQIVQALIAYASGGLLGRGPGLGSPGFVPLAHSDLIFAVVVEEAGLLGGLAVLGLLAYLVQRGLRLALHRRSPFESMLAAGIALTLGLQSILILGGVLRLLPLTGVTVPFLSYGGSSLVTNFLALGLLLATRDGSFGREAIGPRLSQVQLGLTAAWVALAAMLGWWTLVRGPNLVIREDNPRRGLAELYSQRGSILDRTRRPLAETAGERGEFGRFYPDPSASSVVGFDSRRHGQAGIESTLDSWLRGEAGYPPTIRWWSELVRGVPPDGLDVRLSLDPSLQAVAWETLGDRPGAVVVLDAETGEIKALVSSPGFDPSQIDQDWEALRARQDAPLLNRATQGVYQPGIATAPLFVAWAQRLGLVDVSNRVGGMTAPQPVDGHALPCAFSPPEDTPGTLAGTLRYGCATPLSVLGESMGTTGLEEAARAFGMGEGALSDLPGAPPIALERVIPASQPNLVAIGQGDLTVTPLQIARAYAAIAAGGNLPTLRLVLETQTPEGEWQPWGDREPPVPAVPADVASAILNSLRRDSLGNAGFGAYAISGPTGERLAWYVGIVGQGISRHIGLVVLEGGTTDEAGAIALDVLGLRGPAAPP
ncbi:MAG: FtsW/RodA/SpoVE family cell cycle protein [Anaerolineales bacterium]